MSNVRLRHVAQINPLTPAFDRLEDEDQLTFVPMESVWPDGRMDISRVRMKSTVATGYTRFQDGDVLVPKITPTFEAGRSVLIGGLLGGVGAGTTELHIVRPGHRIDPRFLLYTVNTHAFLRLGAAEMYGVAGQQRVPDSFLRDLPVRLPSIPEQRRVADFLDAETARIDKLIQLRKLQNARLNERASSALDHAFQNPAHRPTRLKYLLAVKPRYGVLVPSFVDDGVRFIRVNDLLDLTGRAESLVCIPRELSSQYPRTVTRAGDVLLSVVGTMGRSAIVHPELAGANVARAVASLRAAPKVRPELISTWLTTPEFLRQTVDATSSDTAQPTLGMEDLSNFTLSWPADMQSQTRLFRATNEIRMHQESLRQAFKRQDRLLAERRQALITAAVNGQFDVSTASGRNVTDGVPTA
ncbi:restriction endonuclease subunit S [Streptomyces poriferorum]|uniref:Restriction endonuclease subunit S n=1 Tax=Streptomyces poriferorum TaxID=2798799 RepID=A0ABY9IJZ9_9ACTN|nr:MULTISPECIES: restriction endonuclease subunit S [unclassified Streptomyces]MDP5316636.1 restriction endonuclease subunit S [Streptomyces sp. Alt4]WLQ54941.1 restriction endonuclease subunit S [Streptomyces sp. Alt2]